MRAVKALCRTLRVGADTEQEALRVWREAGEPGDPGAVAGAVLAACWHTGDLRTVTAAARACGRSARTVRRWRNALMRGGAETTA